MRAAFSLVTGARSELVLRCLDSLLAAAPAARQPGAVTVTCNQPGSPLPRELRRRYPNVRVVENPLPQGFAANHNRVLETTDADVVWVLNDDLVFLPGTINAVMDFLAAPGNERVGAVSPRLLNPDGSLQPSTYSFPTVPRMVLAASGLRDQKWMDRLLRRVAPLLRKQAGRSRFWAHDRTTVVDTLRGACVAVRMETVREVGLMSEVALVGAEETEWHRRFRERGWSVIYYPAAEVIHLGAQTVGTDRRLEAEYLKGTLYYFRVWRHPLVYHLLRLLVGLALVLRVALALLAGDRAGAAAARASLRVCLEGISPTPAPRLPHHPPSPGAPAEEAAC